MTKAMAKDPIISNCSLSTVYTFAKITIVSLELECLFKASFIFPHCFLWDVIFNVPARRNFSFLINNKFIILRHAKLMKFSMYDEGLKI